jgi:murein DD-endopeptidase MepM/ murein hydrolase activator NlpD
MVSKEEIYSNFFIQNPSYISDGFDFPVGKPNGIGYSDAQPFTVNSHLGEDWIKNGRNDMGSPIFASSHGLVVFADDIQSGWGSIVRVIHLTPGGKFYETVYAHLQKIRVNVGDKVKKGDMLGTMGDANGAYWVHLHFELRDDIFMSIGPGYAKNTEGYLNPKEFIKKNRKLKI